MAGKVIKCDFPFVRDETPRIRGKIVSDLKWIVDLIKQDFPKATIVLSGSFAYGEGTIHIGGEKIVNQSDYDIYVLLKSPIQIISALRNKKLKNINSGVALKHGFSVDLTVIWQVFLNLGLTFISGKIIYGNPAVGRLIDGIPISRRKLQVAQLKRAYLLLVGALAENEPASLQDALIQGFRSFLGLKETKAEIHGCWKDYFSLHHNLQILAKYRKDLGPDLSELIRSALMSKLNLGKDSFEITPESTALTKEFLNGLFCRVKHTFLGIDYLQYVMQQILSFEVPRLFIDPNKVMLRASYHLSKAIQESEDIDQYELKKAKKILQTIIREKDVEGNEASLAWCKEKIGALGSVYFHKVRQGRNHS